MEWTDNYFQIFKKSTEKLKKKNTLSVCGGMCDKKQKEVFFIGTVWAHID